MSAPKGKGKQPIVKTATETDLQPPVEKDFVPGKISLKEWESLLEDEEGVLTVNEIIEEIVKRASDEIYAKYLDDAAFGYAVQDAKDKILKIIAMEFVGRDEGEKDTESDPTWMEEKEPQPPVIDSWSCGMVPLITRESLLPPVDALSPVNIVKQDIPRSVEFRHNTDTKNQMKVIPPPKSTTRSTTSESSRATSTKQKVSKSRRPKASVHRMIVLDTPPREKEEEVEEAKEDTLEYKEDSPEPDMNAVSHTPFGLKPVQLKWMKEVKYDENGKIVEMVKLDPTKFPSRRIKPIVTVSKPQVSSYRQKRQAKLKPLSPQKALLLPKPHPPKAASSSSSSSITLSDKVDGYRGNEMFYFKTNDHSCRKNQLVRVEYSDIRHSMHDSDGRGQRNTHPSYNREARKVTVMPSGKGLSSEVTARRFPEMPTVPTLVDSIDPLPGVTVREGGRSVHGPAPTTQVPVTPLEGLRPIHSPPQIRIDEHEEDDGALADRKRAVGFAVTDYESRLLPAKVTT